ncbi:MAG: hypothetical protein CSYNP_01580 [Syntrophus sp. SKADARSKE-3]|nr:hypothetical protein [Syntrophus sp. SKADARSKE-3]
MISHIRYDKMTGEIIGTGICHEDSFLQERDNTALMLGDADDLTQYIDLKTWQVVQKSPFPGILTKSTISVDEEAAITNCPIPTTVMVEKCMLPAIVDDGSFEFSFDTPGIYKIICEAFPYLRQEYTVTCE